MRAFIKHIGLLLLSVVCLLYILDWVYAKIYYGETPRDKIAWVKNMPETSYDYAIFGSSRCIHFIQPKVIEQNTSLKGLNLACISSGPLEIKLMVNEFLKKHQAKHIYIQIDYSHNDEEPNYLGRVAWMPYIVEESIYNQFKPYGREYWNYNHIPFYRFQKFGPKIGVRNTALSIVGKEGHFIKSYGFTPQYGIMDPSNEAIIWQIENKKNKHLQEVLSLCKKKNIAVSFFTSPVYNNKTDLSILNTLLPNYSDLSNSVSDIQFFKDNTHLNSEGSLEFTNVFIDTYLKQ
ncbi:MAG: hypothetical protein COA58_14240 [Bacteroidetes bacterium]|nr:MAG: hypothetical protein COA58_14240 [Bacteroidota bacterium]